MAWCASCSSRVRSWAEKWLGAEGRVRREGEASGDDSLGSGHIAFPAPAQDESTAAAFDHMTVDLRPERGKVIDRRYQRQKNHEPDRNESNPVDGKNVRPDRPDFPAVVENDGHHGDDLH